MVMDYATFGFEVVLIFVFFYLFCKLIILGLKKLFNPKVIQSIVRKTRVPTWLSFIGVLGIVYSLLYSKFPQITQEIPPETVAIIESLSSSILIAAIGWWLVMAISAWFRYSIKKLKLEGSEDREEKAIYTQMKLLYRLTVFIIIGVTLALILLTIPGISSIGWGLLSSAGIAGIIAGVSARPVLENLLAGMQIAFTHPIKINDVVIVEKEWGRIEEIFMTHVVIRVWDLRRLVVPISYFITTPFQNWTINSSDLIGSVYLWVDYGAPMEELRKELQTVVQSTDLWDGMVAKLQVVETSEKAMQLRAIVSTRNSQTGWELRCLVREKLIQFLQENHPHTLPTLRLNPSEVEKLPVDVPTV